MKWPINRASWGCLLLVAVSISAARAQDVLGTATIYYDSSSNTMSASCVMDPSYDVLAFYGDPITTCTIYPGGNFDDAIQDIEAATEADIPDFTPEPDLNYIGYGDFQIVMLDGASEYFDGYYWSYYDPYFFDYYGEYPVYSGDPSYDWYGVDDQDFPEVGPILYLGEVTADPVTTPPGPADHVEVIYDSGSGFPTSCATTGVAVRQMWMQIVDSNGVAINTNASDQEVYSNPSQPTSSCASPFGGSPSATGCTASGFNSTTGSFLDTMSVGNQTTFCISGFHTSSCGYSQTSTWSACSGGATNTLWISPRVTQANGVTTNGSSTAFAPGHEFDPQ